MDKVKKPLYEIQDFGTVGPDNAIWLYCENIDVVNKLKPGNTAYVDFKTGMGRSTVRVIRLTDQDQAEKGE
jgi:hypothetical protein